MFSLSECGDYITWNETSRIVMSAEHRNGDGKGWGIARIDTFMPLEPATLAFTYWYQWVRCAKHKDAANIIREMNRKLYDTPLFTEDGVLIYVDNSLSRASYVAHHLQVDLYDVRTHFDPLCWQILGWNKNTPGGDSKIPPYKNTPSGNSGNPHIKIQLFSKEKLEQL